MIAQRACLPGSHFNFFNRTDGQPGLAKRHAINPRVNARQHKVAFFIGCRAPDQEKQQEAPRRMRRSISSSSFVSSTKLLRSGTRRCERIPADEDYEGLYSK